MKNLLKELAEKPADKALLDRAKALCVGRLDLADEFSAMAAGNPTRASVHAFIERAKSTAPAALVDRVDLICKALKIDNPTGQERLLALQVLLMSEQAWLSQQANNFCKGTGMPNQAQNSSSPYLLAGLILGTGIPG